MWTTLILIALALLGAPLFVVIGGSALLGFMTQGRPAADVAGELSRLVQMDTLVTIPLFTFSGYLLAESGAPRRLVAVSRALFGWAPGGMALVTLVTCAFFTTFTGASGITIVALGGLLLPVLLKQGYPRNFSLGLITTSGSRGLVFPPSLPVIIYGYIAAVDITQLYIAGLVPGLIDVAFIGLWCLYTGLTNSVPRTPFVAREAARCLWKALPEFLLPIVLVVLIATAVLKVPEAAALTALYVLILEVVIYRDVHPIRDLPRITREAMVLCGAVLIIVGVSLGQTNYLVDQGIPQKVVATIGSAITNKWVFLLALNGFLLIVGCVMDIFSAIVIVVPLIVPIAEQFAISPFHLAVIFLINLELGYNTPPVGMNLFIASFRFKQPILRLYRAAMPFVLVSLLGLITITYLPGLSTFTVPKETGIVAPRGPTQPRDAPDTADGAERARDEDIDQALEDDIEKELDQLDAESAADTLDNDIDRELKELESEDAQQ